MQKINILFIVNSLGSGGAEKSVFNLASQLVNHNDLKITLLSLIPKNNIYNSDRLSVIYPKKDLLKFYYFWRYPQLFKLIKKSEPNIIHSNMGDADWIASLYKLFHPKSIIISTIHTYGQRRDHKITIKHKIIFKLQSFLYKKFTKIICVSNDLANYFAKEYTININKISIIPNGYYLPKTHLEYNNTKTKNKLLFVGGFRPVKNLKFLISVFLELPLECTLTLIGDGEQKEELIQFCKKLGIIERVIFKGFIENAILEMSKYDILIIPSLYETFSITALEGLIIGIPTLATKNGGIKEIFGNNLNELLFDPYNSNELKNKILYVRSSYSFFVEKIKKEQPRLSKFSINYVAKKNKDLYKSYKKD